MDLNRAVIVTALFDIGRDKWGAFGHSYHTYLEYMKIMLSIDCYMVIYTEQQFAQKILKNRQVVDPKLKKTELKVITKEQFEIYKKFGNQITKLMSSDDFKKQIQFHVPEMTQPWYNFVNFNKIFFIKDACFNSNRFPKRNLYIWKDAGVYRSEKHLYHKRIWPDIKKVDMSKITFFVRSTNDNIPDVKQHLLSQDRKIQGGSFLVPSHYIEYFADEFEKQIKRALNLGVIGSDEKIMDLIYSNNPEFCNKIECEWRQYWKFFKY